MRSVLAILTIAALAGAAGCATGVENNASDAGTDGTAADTSLDRPSDQSVRDSSVDSGFDAIPPTDSGVPFDSGTPQDSGTPLDASDGGCGFVGQPCNTNAFPPTCPLPFLVCMSSVPSGTNDGVCINPLTDMQQCDAVTPCPSGQACLLMSMVCMTQQETACVCDNPQENAACGPPFGPDAGPEAGDGGDSGTGDAAPDSAPDAPSDAATD